MSLNLDTLKVFLADALYWIMQLLKNLGIIDEESANKFTQPEIK